jgi:antitoxin VapB
MNEHRPPKSIQLNLQSQRARDAASALAELTGDSITEAVTVAIEERLARERRSRMTREERIEAILEIGRRYAALPDKDSRSADEILGYDENGLPT